jgi:Arc/MetJ-type ribon-helix-helix transcriptional regulator
VPGKRAFGQKLIPVPMRREFIEHINAAVETLNYGDRSKLIRDAIVEKLNREGIETPPSLAAAPVRVGKTSQNRRKSRQEGS